MEVKVLGMGCDRCKQLYAATKTAIAQSGVEAILTKVEKVEEIKVYKLMATPALVINEKVRSAGRIPEAREIVGWLTTAAMEEEESAKEA